MGAYVSSFLWDDEDQLNSCQQANKQELDATIPPPKYLGSWQVDWPPRDSVVELHAKATDGFQHDKAQKPLLEVKCHKLVLEEGSGLIRQQLAACQSDEGQELTVIPLICPANLPWNQEGAAAVEAVLRFCYTHQLPNNASVGTLINVAVAAHYMDVKWCMKACSVALNNIPKTQLSIKDISRLLDAMSWLPDLATGLDVFNLLKVLPDSTPLSDTEQLEANLTALFGDANYVLSHPQLLDNFAELPLRAVEVWGSMDTIKVRRPRSGSENDIVAMLSYWWYKQPTRGRTASAKQRLSALVRLPLLSSSYLWYVLPAQPWFKKPAAVPANFKQVCMHLRYADIPEDCPYTAGLSDTPRMLIPLEDTDSETDSEVDTEVGTEIGLETDTEGDNAEPVLHQDMKAAHITVNMEAEELKVFLTSKQLKILSPASTHWRGYTWSLKLVKYAKDYECNVRVQLQLPYYMQKPKQRIFATADISLQCNPMNASKKGLLFVLPSDVQGSCGCSVDFNGEDMFPTYAEPDGTYKVSARICNVD